MQIKDMPANERPQEKLLFSGASSLSNAELLALIIRTGTSDKSSIQLAQEVLAYASENIGSLTRADPKELIRIEGIGEAKACSIVAAMELSRRVMSFGVMERGGKLSSCDDVAQLLLAEMNDEKREIFMSIHLNTKMQIESKHIISIGNLDNAPAHPREVFGKAAKMGAAAVVVAHNHPSGDPDPSAADFALTDRLMNASRLMGIRLIDHVIIGNGRYYSMKDNGDMDSDFI